MVQDNDSYTAAETARRRDEVIRRMANTPPQPHIKASRPRKGKPTAAGRAARKRVRGKGA